MITAILIIVIVAAAWGVAAGIKRTVEARDRQWRAFLDGLPPAVREVVERHDREHVRSMMGRGRP